MKRAWMAVSILGLVVGYVGCKKAEPPSPIVKLMEDAGSGDVSKTSDEGITRWLDQHKAVLLEVKKSASKREHPTRRRIGATQPRAVCVRIRIC